MCACFMRIKNFHKMGYVIKPFLKPNNCQAICKIRDAFLKKEKIRKTKNKPTGVSKDRVTKHWVKSHQQYMLHS